MLTPVKHSCPCLPALSPGCSHMTMWQWWQWPPPPGPLCPQTGRRVPRAERWWATLTHPSHRPRLQHNPRLVPRGHHLPGCFNLTSRVILICAHTKPSSSSWFTSFMPIVSTYSLSERLNISIRFLMNILVQSILLQLIYVAVKIFRHTIPTLASLINASSKM